MNKWFLCGIIIGSLTIGFILGRATHTINGLWVKLSGVETDISEAHSRMDMLSTRFESIQKKCDELLKEKSSL